MPDNETLQNVGADIARQNQTVQSDWVKADTPAVVPETTEPAKPHHSATQPRDAGKFAGPPETVETTTPAATTPVAPPVGATAEQIQDFIDAQIEGQTDPFKIPRGVRIPLKRGDQINYVPLTELQAGGMREQDYRHKTGEIGELRRDLQTARARLDAQTRAFETEKNEFLAAQTDPAKWTQWQEHFKQYNENPIYRARVDAAREGQAAKAELDTIREERQVAAVSRGRETVIGWIDELGTQYPAVDKARVQAIYADQLTQEAAPLSREAVAAIYRQEAEYLNRASSPLQTQIEDLKRQVEALSDSQKVQTQNDQTRHAVRRAAAPPVATGAAPGVAVPAGKRFGIQELAERNAEWANKR